MFDYIFESIKKAVLTVVEIIVAILNHAISLMGDIINWFKEKYKAARRYIVYVITAVKLKRTLKGKSLGDLLGNEDVKTISIPGLYGDDQKFEDGVVEVVEDTQTGKIDSLRVIGGTGVDNDLKAAMKDVDVIKLS